MTSNFLNSLHVGAFGCTLLPPGGGRRNGKLGAIKFRVRKPENLATIRFFGRNFDSILWETRLGRQES